MRIAIDVSQIIYGTGVSVYTKELTDNLAKIDKENEYLLFGGSLRRKSELRRYASKVFSISPTMADFIWNRMHVFDIERLIGKIDVLHSSDWTQPPTNAFKVTTVHDLSPIKFAKETPKKITEVHRRRLYWVLKEVDRIIVPTNAIKNDLIELGARQDRIRVIYEAAGGIFRKQSDERVSEVKRKYGIHGDFVMTLGVGERKNTARLIEAFQKSKVKGLKLVIIGGQKGNFDNRNVIYTGFVDDGDLISFYSGAKALVYPSLYEGFGLPIVQAMQCECPVVTSNIGAMKEVAGEAAILVDPNDINSIAEGIEKGVNSPKTLIKKGLKRVKDFNWEKVARQTLEVYREKS